MSRVPIKTKLEILKKMVKVFLLIGYEQVSRQGI